MTRSCAGAALSAVDSAARRLSERFAAAGFARVEPNLLQPATLLLDLYGEDIRSRAFLFDDGDRRELCLRPDFTIPVCRMYLQGGEAGREARYSYFGPVFRRPAPGVPRPAEFLQAGVELYGASDRAAADAEVFALIRDAAAAIAPAGELEARTGDLGIAFALLDAIDMPARWRWRLKRRFWRPRRFHELLRAYAGDNDSDDDSERVAFLKAIGGLGPDQARAAVVEVLAMSNTPHVGLRSTEEIAARFLEQAQDASAPPLPRERVSLIEAALATKGPSGLALTRLRDLARAAGVDIAAALNAMEARLTALDALGVAAAELPFDAAFGRRIEYYDGFVFEIAAPGAAFTATSARRLAGGGRYDGLLRAAGAARPVPAVGAALHPEELLACAKAPS